MGDWINVNEKFPENEHLVLMAIRNVYDGSYAISVGMFTDGKHHLSDCKYMFSEDDIECYFDYDFEENDWLVPEQWWSYDGDKISDAQGYVTHWMELPDPPAIKSICP